MTQNVLEKNIWFHIGIRKDIFHLKQLMGIFSSPNGQNNTFEVEGEMGLLIPQGEILGRIKSQQEGSAGIGSPAARDLCQTRTEHGQVYFQWHSCPLPMMSVT